MQISQPVSHECIDGEVVAIHMGNGTYYSMLDVAAVLWQSIAAGVSSEELILAAQRAYPDQPESREETARFLDQLVAEGLVVAADDAPVAKAGVPAFPARYVTPKLELFTDLQELLMLDPIHEVDATGWPHKN